MLNSITRAMVDELNDKFGYIINFKEIQKFSKILLEKIFEPLTKNLEDDEYIYPILYMIVIGRKKYLTDNTNYKMSYEEKIGREIFVLDLKHEITTDLLTYGIISSIYRSLHKH